MDGPFTSCSWYKKDNLQIKEMNSIINSYKAYLSISKLFMVKLVPHFTKVEQKSTEIDSKKPVDHSLETPLLIQILGRRCLEAVEQVKWSLLDWYLYGHWSWSNLLLSTQDRTRVISMHFANWIRMVIQTFQPMGGQEKIKLTNHRSGKICSNSLLWILSSHEWKEPIMQWSWWLYNMWYNGVMQSIGASGHLAIAHIITNIMPLIEPPVHWLGLMQSS